MAMVQSTELAGETQQYDDDATYTGVEMPIIELQRKDGLEIRSRELQRTDVVDWFNGDYIDDYPLRVVCRKTENWSGPGSPWPFPQGVMETTLGEQRKQYEHIWRSEAGGSVATQTWPTKLYIQTPSDGGPFCSMAFTTTGFGRGPVKGLFYYTDDHFSLANLLESVALQSGWRGNGFHLMVPAVAFLAAHVAYKARELSTLRTRITQIEAIISQPRHPDDDSLDFGALSRALHECHTTLILLERRARFESGLVKSVESYFAFGDKHRVGGVDLLRGPLELQKNLMEAQGYDLESLPKRVESQRTMIFNLIVQRDQRLNLAIGRSNTEIAESSHRMAEASVLESQSMRTIAVMTLIFLPSTAIASFFSMTMFDWRAPQGQPIVVDGIWVFFVVSVPLTIVVVLIWWIFLRKQRGRVQNLSRRPTSVIAAVNDRLGTGAEQNATNRLLLNDGFGNDRIEKRRD